MVATSTRLLSSAASSFGINATKGIIIISSSKVVKDLSLFLDWIELCFVEDPYPSG